MVSQSPLILTDEQKTRVRQLLNQWSKSARTGTLETPCQLWQGVQRREGVGAMHIAPGEAYDVHRLAYVCAYGDLPAGTLVRHLCHCSLCVNPDHLTIGDDRLNNLDTIRAGNRVPPKKLTSEQLSAINTLHDGFSSRQIARLLHLPRTTIRDAIKRSVRPTAIVIPLGDQ